MKNNIVSSNAEARKAFRPAKTDYPRLASQLVRKDGKLYLKWVTQ
jgi:hypothetical protein